MRSGSASRAGSITPGAGQAAQAVESGETELAQAVDLRGGQAAQAVEPSGSREPGHVAGEAAAAGVEHAASGGGAAIQMQAFLRGRSGSMSGKGTIGDNKGPVAAAVGAANVIVEVGGGAAGSNTAGLQSEEAVSAGCKCVIM